MRASQATGHEENFPTSPPPGGWVIYDGDCGLCSRLALWLNRRDKAKQFHLLTQLEARERLPLSSLPADVQDSLCLLTPNRTAYQGAGAAARILRQLPYPWSLLGRVLMLPIAAQVSASLNWTSKSSSPR